MKSYLVLVLIFLPFSVFASPSPLSIDWQNRHKHVPSVKHYKHFFGSVKSGSVYYTTDSLLFDVENELHLHFHKGRIHKAIIVAGTNGITEQNCFKKHSNFVDMLTKKYGKADKISVTKDLDHDDLFYVNKCSLVRNGLYVQTTSWSTKKHHINLNFFGEFGEYYIEVEYINKQLSTDLDAAHMERF